MRRVRGAGVCGGHGHGRLGGEDTAARTAYDYDYGAYDTYEAYPQEDAVALYENNACALGAQRGGKGRGERQRGGRTQKIVRNAWLTLENRALLTRRFPRSRAD